MFSSIIALIKTAAKVIADGLKKILGSPTEPDATVLASKGVAVVVALVALLAQVLPFPTFQTWSDTLFRVSFQFWNAKPLGRIA